MGEEAKYMVGAVAAVVVFGWGIIRWAISRHDALRKDLSKQIEDANTAMNNRILETQRSIQSASDITRDRIDGCAQALRSEISQKADRADVIRATDKLFALMDEQRDRLLDIVSEFRKG